MNLGKTLRIGMILIFLGVVACAEYQPPPPPPPPPAYYVVPNKVFLRDCPGDDCRIIGELYNGDRVEQMDVNAFGWWRVRSDRTGQIGWMPGSLLSLSPVRPPAPRYYVSISSLNLRLGPTTASRIKGILYLNDEVEKIDQTPAGWFKVRRLRDGATGWVAARYLETYPVRAPRRVYRKRRRPAKKPEAPKKEKPAPAKAKPL